MPDRDDAQDEIRIARAKLDAALAEGLADIKAGRVSDAEEVFARLEERYRNWPPKKAKETGGT